LGDLTQELPTGIKPAANDVLVVSQNDVPDSRRKTHRYFLLPEHEGELVSVQIENVSGRPRSKDLDGRRCGLQVLFHLTK